MAALSRKEEQVLLVRQQGPGDPTLSWSVHGGVVEDGELLTEALAREVQEEMGLLVGTLCDLAYVVHFDNSNSQQLHVGLGPGNRSTALVFEVEDWTGELHVNDPDGFVLEARFLPVSDALRKL